MPLVAMQPALQDWQIATMPIEMKPDKAWVVQKEAGDVAMFRSMMLDCCENNPLACDSYSDSLNAYGLSGLGAAVVAKPAPAPEKVTLEAPPPLRQSTIYGVTIASVLVIMGSVALWAWFKGRKK